jgi:hypothetical protein
VTVKPAGKAQAPRSAMDLVMGTFGAAKSR